MNESLQSALRALYDDLIARFRQHHGTLPFSTFQDDWDSPCVDRVDPDNRRIYWRPVQRDDPQSMPEVERGLEVAIHPDLLTYYGSQWADGIRVDSPWGEIGLVQVWNPEDQQFLKENLLGHAFVRLKQRRPLTFFFAVQREERVISLDNERGVVIRERAGKRGDEVLSESLEDFLRQLTPNLMPYDEF